MARILLLFSSTVTTTDKNTRLLLGLGYTNNDTYWIDDVELIPDAISPVKAPGFENPSADINANWNIYIDNPSYGNNAVDCTTASEGSCSEKITSNIATTTDWKIQLYQAASTTLNQTDVLSFDAIAGALGLSKLLTFAVTSGSAGGLTAGTEAGGNYLLGQSTDDRKLGVDTATAAVSAGWLSTWARVSGANVQSLKAALSVFSKAHAARTGAESLFGTAMQSLGSAAYGFASSGGFRPANTGIGGINSSARYTTPSGAVVTWGGQLISGAPRNR